MSPKNNDNVIPASASTAPLLVSMREAAAMLGLAYPTIRSWLQQGKLGVPTVTLGRRRLVSVKSIHDYIDALVANASATTIPPPPPKPPPPPAQKRGRGRPRRDGGAA
ncbi:MAG: helix-turn-helix domain-containing protein [Rugosibacter sp.]